MKNMKTILFVAAYVMGLAALAIVGYLYADYTVSAEHHKSIIVNEKFHTDVAYIDLPPVNLTLSSSLNNASGRVRLNISLEVERKYAGRVEDYMPRITDRIVDYTHKLDYDEVSQPNATKWLRERFLQIANTTSAPAPVIDVIFRQFLVL